MSEWFINTAEGQQGPYSTENIKEWLEAGSVTGDTFVWKEGMAEWVALSTVSEISSPTPVASPPPPSAAPPSSTSTAPPAANDAPMPQAVSNSNPDPVETSQEAASKKSRMPKIKPLYAALVVFLLAGGAYAADQSGLLGGSEPGSEVIAEIDLGDDSESDEDEFEKEESEDDLVFEEQDPPEPFVASNDYKARNVVVFVIDGPRFSEAWGEPDKKHIKALTEKLAPEGVVFPNFFNNGVTKTVPGHTALATGYYQEISNTGVAVPDNPTFLHRWLKKHDAPGKAAWIVASKNKLDVLANTIHEDWEDQYLPNIDAGLKEPRGNMYSKYYRPDGETMDRLKGIVRRDHPQLIFVNVKEPDAAAHDKDWDGYTDGIEKSFGYAAEFWEHLQEIPFYKDNTAFFVTNDHGRHLDGVDRGKTSHGDDCEGCRHILLYAAGPDFPKDKIIETEYEQIDLTVTIAKILGIEIPNSKGKVIEELFVSDTGSDKKETKKTTKKKKSKK
ncbi:MAG: DUF4339 domain-containing protein [Candidatus Lindowbacteria bacterium]|nr:DUF4339 domain-containing protein [Candidatus Lindowbacteria bacterium]